jgi:hypothetical protein
MLDGEQQPGIEAHHAREGFGVVAVVPAGVRGAVPGSGLCGDGFAGGGRGRGRGASPASLSAQKRLQRSPGSRPTAAAVFAVATLLTFFMLVSFATSIAFQPQSTSAARGPALSSHLWGEPGRGIAVCRVSGKFVGCVFPKRF